MKIPLRESARPSSRIGLLFFVRVAGLIALCLVIVLSIIPGQMQVRTSAPKEFEHLIAYFIVASALALGYRHRVFVPAVGIFLIAVAGAVELLQKLVPGRTATLVDWEASTMGVILGIVFAVVFSNIAAAMPKRKR